MLTTTCATGEDKERGILLTFVFLVVRSRFTGSLTLRSPVSTTHPSSSRHTHRFARLRRTFRTLSYPSSPQLNSPHQSFAIGHPSTRSSSWAPTTRRLSSNTSLQRIYRPTTEAHVRALESIEDAGTETSAAGIGRRGVKLLVRPQQTASMRPATVKDRLHSLPFPSILGGAASHRFTVHGLGSHPTSVCQFNVPSVPPLLLAVSIRSALSLPMGLFHCSNDVL